MWAPTSATSWAARVRGPIACTECHVVPGRRHPRVPAACNSPGVRWRERTARPPRSTPPRSPAPTTVTARESSGSVPAPVWNKVDGTQAACGACHGLPPPFAPSDGDRRRHRLRRLPRRYRPDRRHHRRRRRIAPERRRRALRNRRRLHGLPRRRDPHPGRHRAGSAPRHPRQHRHHRPGSGRAPAPPRRREPERPARLHRVPRHPRRHLPRIRAAPAHLGPARAGQRRHPDLERHGAHLLQLLPRVDDGGGAALGARCGTRSTARRPPAAPATAFRPRRRIRAWAPRSPAAPTATPPP